MMIVFFFFSFLSFFFFFFLAQSQCIFVQWEQPTTTKSIFFGTTLFYLKWWLQYSHVIRLGYWQLGSFLITFCFFLILVGLELKVSLVQVTYGVKNVQPFKIVTYSRTFATFCTNSNLNLYSYFMVVDPKERSSFLRLHQAVPKKKSISLIMFRCNSTANSSL